MTSLQSRLAGYGAYHRDGRNVATHLIGIPMIVVAVVVLLSRPVLHAGGVPVTPAMAAALASVFFYVRLDLRFGLVMAALLALACRAGLAVAGWESGAWAAIGVGLFVVGWIFQFVGHGFEGRKPAFLDDVAGLIVGPLFVVAEVAVLLGLRRELAAALKGSAAS